MLKVNVIDECQLRTRSLKTAISVSALMLGLSACSSNQVASTDAINSEELAAMSEQLTAREAALEERESKLLDKEIALQQLGTSANESSALVPTELLPPNPEPGHCYARVWVEPTFRTREETVLVSEASEKISIIPASYETVSESVLKKPETTKLVTIPAVYETVSEQKLVKEGGTFWLSSLRNGVPIDKSVLKDVENAGINLASTTPGICYHEHFKAAQYTTDFENVLVKEESERVETVDAEYRWTEKQVLVSEASTRLEQVPAVYKTVQESVLDVPAHTVWKKGSGPIQKIDEATGEIMCLVEVPASYKTITKQVLVSDATTRSVEIPAQYKTVKVRELVSDAAERRISIPAEYKQVSVTKQVSDPTFVWHEVHDDTMSKESRTGRQVCLVERDPVYQTVQRRIVKTPASVQKQIIPAEYETISVQKLVQDAQEVKTVIPASYKSVSIREIDTEGKMEWRSILCETNMTRSRITDLQRALKSEGYDPGEIDGVIGRDTMNAVNRYQRDNNLPVDKYLNIETLNALNISAI